MERQQLIDMLNQDLADEHASVIRYLVHAYQLGENTPLGAALLSNAREEMWHMDWLADEIGEMGAEPEMKQGVYPHDPTSNASLLRSYIAWEKRLVQLYAEQAAQVSSAGLKRVLMQQSLESATHRKRFEEWLEKLGPEGEQPLVYGDAGAFSPEMSQRLQSEMSDEYQLVLQHLRHAFVFDSTSCPVGSELELTAMRHMKHMSYFAEELAESGHEPQFVHPTLDVSSSVERALTSDVGLTRAARDRFAELSQDPELSEHAALQIEVENLVLQEEFLASNVGALLEETQKPEPDQEPPEAPGFSSTGGRFTVGSLIQKH